VLWRDRWLTDGALVNPVPVSVCHALGADVVIAVNPSGFMVRRGSPPRDLADESEAEALDLVAPGERGGLLGRIGDLWQGARQLVGAKAGGKTPKAMAPGALEVMQGAIVVMQDRITRSRLAGEPPDVMLLPRVNHIGLLEYHRASEAIAAGRECVERAQEAIALALEN
jgi:NTE family protein